MNYLQIEAFLKTIELGSMTKAANALFISQSTLSGRITQLEEEIGVELFSRGHGSKGVVLTPKGINFIDYAKKYLSLINDIDEWKIDSEIRIDINIGAPHSVNGFFLNEFYKKYADSNEVKLNISSHWNHNIYTMLDTFDLDLGIVSRPYGSRHIKTQEFFKEPLYIVYNSEYADYSHVEDASGLDKCNEIHLDWGPDYELWYQKYWSLSSIPKVTVDSPELVYEFLKTKNAWAVMPMCIYSYLKSINYNIQRIENISGFYRNIYLVTQGEPKGLVIDFIENLKSYVTEMEEKGLCKTLFNFYDSYKI